MSRVTKRCLGCGLRTRADVPLGWRLIMCACGRIMLFTSEVEPVFQFGPTFPYKRRHDPRGKDVWTYS